VEGQIPTEHEMTRSWKPADYTSVSPYLITANAGAVIDFLVSVFRAEPLRRYENDDGSIMHAEVRLDDTVIMIGEAGGQWPAVPCHIHVYVPDVDATYSTAVRHGAESVQEPTRRGDDPDRRGGVLDQGGNTWWIGTQTAG
jgi:uncharacterized glyoxalase superfamily protein PhnB